MTTPQDQPETMLQKVERAIALLGGREATARILGMSDRSLRFLLSGRRNLHTGILEDLARALIAKAEACRQLEREISPAFAANVTDEVVRPHGNSAFARRRAVEEQS